MKNITIYKLEVIKSLNTFFSKYNLIISALLIYRKCFLNLKIYEEKTNEFIKKIFKSFTWTKQNKN